MMKNSNFKKGDYVIIEEDGYYFLAKYIEPFDDDMSLINSFPPRQNYFCYNKQIHKLENPEVIIKDYWEEWGFDD